MLFTVHVQWLTYIFCNREEYGTSDSLLIISNENVDSDGIDELLGARKIDTFL